MHDLKVTLSNLNKIFLRLRIGFIEVFIASVSRPSVVFFDSSLARASEEACPPCCLAGAVVLVSGAPASPALWRERASLGNKIPYPQFDHGPWSVDQAPKQLTPPAWMCYRTTIMDSEQAYRQYLENQEKEFETRCRRCGACCGAEEDPCEHLQAVSSSSYICAIYQQRFGTHRTKSGKEMRCVELRDMRHQEWPGGWKCGYLTKVESREKRSILAI